MLIKNSIVYFGFLLIGTMLFSSCGTSKMGKLLNAHEQMLADAIKGNLSQEEKLDVVATSFVNALEEALSYSQTKKSVQHIDKYSKANEKNLNILLKDVEGWVGNMSTPEKVMMISKVASKPYTGKLIELVPKFERKVNRKITTFKIASKIIGIVKPKLF